MAQQNSIITNRQSDHRAGFRWERQLLATAKSGSSPSFEALCAPYADRFLKAALGITRNREDAEDAVQDSLMRAFVHIKEFRGSSSFSTWLTRIVINSALMIRRKNQNARHVFIDGTFDTGKGRLQIQIPNASPNPEQAYVARERRKALRKAVAALRPRVRAVVQGQLQDFSLGETAKVLDISVAAAKGRLFHGRAALRRSAALRAIAKTRTEPAA